MKPWVAIVKTTPEGRVAKYLDFDTEAAAKVHAAQYGGIVVESAGRKFFDWRVVDGSVAIDPFVPFVEHKTDLSLIQDRLAALESRR